MEDLLRQIIDHDREKHRAGQPPTEAFVDRCPEVCCWSITLCRGPHAHMSSEAGFWTTCSCPRSVNVETSLSVLPYDGRVPSSEWHGVACFLSDSCFGPAERAMMDDDVISFRAAPLSYWCNFHETPIRAPPQPRHRKID